LLAKHENDGEHGPFRLEAHETPSDQLMAAVAPECTLPALHSTWVVPNLTKIKMGRDAGK
jgi:hypothetical protein